MGENSFTAMDFGQGFSEVLAAAKLSKEWAWASIYQTIAGPVTGYLRSQGAPEPIDLAGDVFFELARSIDRFEGDASAFKTYVFVIAHQKLHQGRQRDQQNRSVLSGEVLAALRSDDATMATGHDDPRFQEVIAAFEILDADQRDVLSLRIIAGLTAQETADVINRGVRKVKSIQRQALARIRNRLPAWGGTP